jgi:Flp pilus assembly protein TadG
MRRNQSGTTTVEFAIIGTVVMTVLFGVIELSRALFVMNALAEVTRRGARVATVCPVSDPAGARAAVFADGDGRSTVVTGLTTGNVVIEYLNEAGSALPDPRPASATSVTSRRASNFTHQLVIPFVMPSMVMPGCDHGAARVRHPARRRGRPLLTARTREEVLMDGNFRILLVSRSREMLDELEAAVRDKAMVVPERQLVVNGHVDPLHGAKDTPDALVLHLSQNWREELAALIQRPAEQRPLLVVLGPAADMNAMRLAMQAGARDFLPVPLVQEDLHEALERIVGDLQATIQTGQTAVTAVVNSKGGAGATLLACNVAHLMSVVSQRRVAGRPRRAVRNPAALSRPVSAAWSRAGPRQPR